MRQIIESMTALVFIIILCLTGMDLLNVHLEAGKAKDYRNQVVAVVTNSDYDISVIKECFLVAERNNYDLSFKFYRDDGTSLVWDRPESELEEDIVMMHVRLRYDLQIPLLHSKVTKELLATI